MLVTNGQPARESDLNWPLRVVFLTAMNNAVGGMPCMRALGWTLSCHLIFDKNYVVVDRVESYVRRQALFEFRGTPGSAKESVDVGS